MFGVMTLVLLVETVLVTVRRVHDHGKRRRAHRTGHSGDIVRIDRRRVEDRWRFTSAHQNGGCVEVHRWLRVLRLVIRIIAIVVAVVLIVHWTGRRKRNVNTGAVFTELSLGQNRLAHREATGADVTLFRVQLLGDQRQSRTVEAFDAVRTVLAGDRLAIQIVIVVDVVRAIVQTFLAIAGGLCEEKKVR